MPTNYSYTPLVWAARNGNLEVVKVLVENGANINFQTTLHGFSPLMLAARYGRVEIVTFLISAGADLAARDKEGLSVEDHARIGGVPVALLKRIP